MTWSVILCHYLPSLTVGGVPQGVDHPRIYVFVSRGTCLVNTLSATSWPDTTIFLRFVVGTSYSSEGRSYWRSTLVHSHPPPFCPPTNRPFLLTGKVLCRRRDSGLLLTRLTVPKGTVDEHVRRAHRVSRRKVRGSGTEVPGGNPGV